MTAAVAPSPERKRLRERVSPAAPPAPPGQAVIVAVKPPAENAELAKSGKVVFDPERGHESPIPHAEDVDLVDVLEPPSGRGHVEPDAKVRPGALEPGYHLLAFGDQIDDFHREVRKRALERADPAPCHRRELASRDLIENVEVPLSQPPRQPGGGRAACCPQQALTRTPASLPTPCRRDCERARAGRKLITTRSNVPRRIRPSQRRPEIRPGVATTLRSAPRRAKRRGPP